MNRRGVFGSDHRTGPFEVIGKIFKAQEMSSKRYLIFRLGRIGNGAIAATALGEAD